MNKEALKDSEYVEIVKDLLVKEEVKDLKNYKHHINSNRLEHSINVSYYSYKKAKKLRLDYVSCARAGLLHDLFYYDTDDSDIKNREHLREHPKIALKNANKITKLNKKEEDIILKHMFGVVLTLPKYKESWLVSLQDKLTSSREGAYNTGIFINKIYRNNIKNYEYK